ncbi:MAG: hypothetical protein HYV28_08700 [Ignavibacteriales bacterium]|nr:hypothetical protein [Ignavibacteriales bacterium]
MKHVLLIVVFFIISTALQAQESLAMLQFSKSLQSYFVDPNFDELKDLALEFKDIAAFKDPANQPGPMGFFYAAFKSVEDTVALRAFINSECAGNELLVKAFTEARSDNNILNINAHDPNLNDFYWGAFFGSGGKEYIERITFELDNMRDRINADLYLAAASAKWSLCLNAQRFALVRQHLQEIKTDAAPSVKREIDSLLTMKPGEIKEEMIKVLKEITDKKQTPAHEEAK